MKAEAVAHEAAAMARVKRAMVEWVGNERPKSLLVSNLKARAA